MIEINFSHLPKEYISSTSKRSVVVQCKVILRKSQHLAAHCVLPMLLYYWHKIVLLYWGGVV